MGDSSGEAEQHAAVLGPDASSSYPAASADSTGREAASVAGVQQGESDQNGLQVNPRCRNATPPEA